MENHDVIIIGGGPTGLSAAKRLCDLGIKNVIVLERELEAGGVPRHCGHLGFGWQSHKRFWTGPRFAAELRKAASAIDVRIASTVLELGENGIIRVQGKSGISELKAKHILIATGIRETPRSARLVGGARPHGVMNTGALQQHVYLYNNKPFEHPVIVGSEPVSFSALLTCRHLGIRPAAMLEEGSSISAPWPAAIISRLAFGVPVLRQSKLLSIEGRNQVAAVEIERSGKRQRIVCDGVIFTGLWNPEIALMPKGSFLENLGSHAQGKYSAAGNVLAPLKTSGQCWQQGVIAAEEIAMRLA